MKKLIFGILLSLFLAVGLVFATQKYLRYIKRSDNIPLYEVKKPRRIYTSTGNETLMSLKNVNFRFTPRINLELAYLKAKLTALPPNTLLNFDDINSFQIRILEGEALLHVDVMKHIFKDNIFNYEGSPLKLDTIQLLPPGKDGSNQVKLTGEMKFILWLKFEMIGDLLLDKQNMKIVIAAKQIKALYNPYTKGLLGFIGLNLEKLLPVPDGRGIAIRKNKIIVSPYSLFPPPKLSGDIESMSIQGDNVLLKFQSNTRVQLPPPPRPNAANYLFVYKGDLKFGKLVMYDAYLEMVDKDPSDIFDFYLKDYHRVLTSGGSAIIQPNKSVLVNMPDYNDVIKTAQ